MATENSKQITELAPAQSATSGDLLLIRKSASGTDNSLSFQNLVQSIGSPAVTGFTAAQAVDGHNAAIPDAIVLTPVNNALITSYQEGMKISFKSPVKSTGVVSIGIKGVASSPVKLYQYNTTVNVRIEIGEYIEAIFINGRFERVNDLQSLARTNVYTNDYKVILTDIATDKTYTNFTLASAYGLTKTEYYDGMSITFMCPADTAGWTKVSIDGLAFIPVSQHMYHELEANDFVATPLYANTIIQAVYDATHGYFLKNQFATPKINPLVAVKVAPAPEVPPANDPSKITCTVGEGNNTYKTLPAAYEALIKQYGQDGNGHTITLLVQTTLPLDSNCLVDAGLRPWIVLQGVNNQITLVINTSDTQIWCTNSPPVFAANTEIVVSGETSLTSGPQALFRVWLQSGGQAQAHMKLAYLKITTGQYIKFQTVFQILSTNTANIVFKNVTVSVLGEVQSVLMCISSTGIGVSILGSAFKGTGVKAYCVYFISCTSCQLLIQNSDLARQEIADVQDIFVQCKHTTVTQVNSRAKSNITINGQDNEGNTYKVTGSQDVVGT